MSRRRQAEKRAATPDGRHQSPLVGRLINVVMSQGKKTVAQKVVYGAFDILTEKLGEDSPVDILQRAVENVRPRLEVKSRRVGGATYQVPLEVSPERQNALALRWLVKFAGGRRSIPMKHALAGEIMDAYRGQGAAIKRRDEVHKMATSNKAFAHFRW